MNTTTETMIFQSDSMEPAIDFGDEIEITPTDGIQGDGIYMLHYAKASMKPSALRHLCADVVKIIRRVKRLDDGALLLSSDGFGYGCDEIVSETALAGWCRIVGTVEVVQRNGLGFRAMSANWKAPAFEAVAA